MEETTFSFLTGHTNCVQMPCSTASSVTITEDGTAGKCEDMETLMILAKPLNLTTLKSLNLSWGF